MSNVKIKSESNNGQRSQFLPTVLPWHQIEDVFDRFMTRFPFHRENGKEMMSIDVNLNPKVDIVEDKKSYKLKAELPGIDVKDISLELSDGTITLSGEKKVERKEDEDDNYHLMECHYGMFRRTFSLPQTVDEKRIKADFKDGILNVVFPKSDKAQEKQRKIAINT